MTLQNLMHIRTGPAGVMSRRAFVRNVAATAGALGVLGWRDAVALNAQELRRQGRHCILLFMRGGPSQFETFDPKPGTTNGGPTRAIDTAAAGVRVAEGWERTAQAMRDIALLRSVNNREGEHQRATYQMHTGYVPNGSVRYPAFGAVAAKYAGPPEFDLPHFVTVGGRGGGNGSGPLGMAYTPFVVNDPNRMPNNVEMPGGVNSGRFDRRLTLMRDLSEEYAESGGRNLVDAHGTVINGAARMVRSPRLRAFDLSQERDADRDRYGRTAFGQGCLLARRLVEAGVTFVEVESNGWDTHQENFTATRRLAGTVDPGFGSLVTDLRERGLLERTLVIWMGEFGRTPRINGNNGRDHWPRSFTVALAGAGIRGGRTLGATSSSGTEVTQRPVGVADLFCTFCQALGINPRREYMTPLARPVPIVEGGRPVAELFS